MTILTDFASSEKNGVLQRILQFFTKYSRNFVATSRNLENFAEISPTPPKKGQIFAKNFGKEAHDFVLSPGNPSAAANEPDSVSHEHHIYFFPDCGSGTAKIAGPGWRGGNGARAPTFLNGP